MAISIVSGRISTIRGASPNAPAPSGADMNFTCTGMHCEGSVQFNGLPADPRANWHVGWVQAQWIETNWGNYRGQFDRDGSIFLQRARGAARPHQACRDTSGPVGDFFTDPTDVREFKPLPAAGAFPLPVSVESNDPPGESYPLILQNRDTHRPNFLQEVQLEFHFVTVLTVRDPARNFHHQAHFYWNVHWQFRFRPQAFPAPTSAQWTITRVPAGTSAHHGHAIAGVPSDRRFTGVLTSVQTQSCVDMATFASNNARRQDFQRWQDVDVRR